MPTELERARALAASSLECIRLDSAETLAAFSTAMFALDRFDAAVQCFELDQLEDDT